MRKFFYLILLCALFQSCMTTKTPVGQYNSQSGSRQHYSQGKQVWLFGGLLPLGRTAVATPADGNCLIKTKYNFWDFLVTTVTVGVIKTYTIEVYVKRDGNSSENTSNTTYATVATTTTETSK